MFLRKLWNELNGEARTRAPSWFAAGLDDRVLPIEILDVGAMGEGAERYEALVEAGLARVTGFEPNDVERERLEARGGDRRYLPHFLGNGGPATFHETRYPGCSSLLEPDPSVIDLFSTIGCAHPGGNFHVQRSRPVTTTRLDDLDAGVTVDYLKIDIQGGELDVLRNGAAKLAATLVIDTEVEFVPLYKDQPLFGDVQCFLRDRGFVLHKLIDVAGRGFAPFKPSNPYEPISQLLWSDAVFVRDFTRLETYSETELLKAALILDLVYASYDLAALLLREHDRRRGTDLHERHAGTLEGRPAGSCLNIKRHA